MLYVRRIVAVITRYYPFSLMFRNRPFHAYWIGVDCMLSYLFLSAVVGNNHFIVESWDRVSDFYVVTGKLEKETDEDVFEGFEKMGAKGGLIFWYRGKLEGGIYKFMAPVDQDWLKNLF